MLNSLKQILTLENFEILKLEEILKLFCTEYSFKTCLVTQKEEGTNYFEELILIGFQNEEFYYNFLAEGKKEKQDLLNSSIPIKFQGETYDLFLGKKSTAIGFRIFTNKPLGFVLLETEDLIQPEQELAIILFFNKLSNLMDKGFDSNLSQIEELDDENEDDEIDGIFDIIFEKSSGIENSLKANRFLFLQGSEGSGKNSFITEYRKKLSPKKMFNICKLNSNDDTEKKINSALESTIGSASAPIKIIYDIENTTKIQQELLYQILLKPILEPKIFFLSSKYKFKEEFKPFWDLLRIHTIKFPDLIEISHTKLRQIIILIFKHYKEFYKKNNLEVSEEVYEYLFNLNYKENLKELKQIIKNAVLNSVKNNLSIQDFEEFQVSEKNTIEILEDLDLRKAIQNIEKQFILLANKKYEGNQVRMARALGISRGSLQYKIKQLEQNNAMD